MDGSPGLTNPVLGLADGIRGLANFVPGFMRGVLAAAKNAGANQFCEACKTRPENARHHLSAEIAHLIVKRNCLRWKYSSRVLSSMSSFLLYLLLRLLNLARLSRMLSSVLSAGVSGSCHGLGLQERFPDGFPACADERVRQFCPCTRNRRSVPGHRSALFTPVLIQSVPAFHTYGAGFRRIPLPAVPAWTRSIP